MQRLYLYLPWLQETSTVDIERSALPGHNLHLCDAIGPLQSPHITFFAIRLRPFGGMPIHDRQTAGRRGCISLLYAMA